MTVLTIIDPGCNSRTPGELRDRAETLLTNEFQYEGGRSTAWGTDHHHVCGRVECRDRFDRLRRYTLRDALDFGTPTVQPLRNPSAGPECGGCGGSGWMRFTAARNRCPLCGGSGKQNLDVDPYVFPMWLFDPGYGLFAVVTPDSRWTDDRTPAGWLAADWDSHVRTVCEYYRHCYGVVNWVKS